MTVDPSELDPRVAGALAGVHDLDDLPLAEHVTRFDALHEALSGALGSIDEV